MGLAASQARLLALTARLSDLELQGQQVSGQRQRLAVQSEAVATKYANALAGQTTSASTSSSASSSSASSIKLSLTAMLSAGLNGTLTNQTFLVNSSTGKIALTGSIANAYSFSGGDYNKFLSNLNVSGNSYYQNLFNQIKGNSNGYESVSSSNSTDTNWLSNAITKGGYYFTEMIDGKATAVDWGSQDNDVTSSSSNDTMALAEAEYDAETAKIQAKDKQLELSMKNIDTEHSAIQTEYDSVKKVIDKNIERSFKVFNS